MDKNILINKIKNRLTTRETKYRIHYKNYLRLYNFLKNIADAKHLKPAKGKLRDYQLSLLHFADQWFEKFKDLNISYFLISGNLLGAYRNSGFIPWDDDFDIGMMRDDFERLKKYLKENYIEIDTSSISYSRRNHNKIIREHLKKYPNQISFLISPILLKIFYGDDMETLKIIDIHPYDYYKDDYDIEEHKNYIHYIKSKKKEIDNYSEINKFLENERLNNPNIVKCSNKIYYGIDNYDSEFLECYEWYQKNDVFPVHTIKFEGKDLFVPNNIHKSLLINYGANYMSMPNDIVLDMHINNRKKNDLHENNISIAKRLILKKLKRKFYPNKILTYKELCKQKKPLVDFLLNIVDLKTVRPCPESFLRNYQLNTLEFCKKMTDFFDNNCLEYFITSGTLIGAIRHQGFIPWDDDFDVGLMRKDYEKLKEILKKNFIGVDISKITISKNNKLKIVDEALKKSDGKILYYIEPKYIQIYQGSSIKDCSIIDIFVHEYYRDDYTISEHKKYISKIWTICDEKNNYEKIMDFLDYEIKNNPNVREKSKTIYYGVDSLGSYIVNPTNFMSEDMIFPRKKVKFEHYEFYAPSNPEGYIKVQYKNYMQFPSELIIAPDLEERLKY